MALCLDAGVRLQRSGYGCPKINGKGGHEATITDRLVVRSGRPAKRKSGRLSRESSRVGGALAAARVSGRLRLH